MWALASLCVLLIAATTVSLLGAKDLVRETEFLREEGFNSTYHSCEAVRALITHIQITESQADSQFFVDEFNKNFGDYDCYEIASYKWKD